MRIILRFILLLQISFFAQPLLAQREANIWYFGRFLGLDFNSGVAVPLNNGMTNTIEGVATISSSVGSLLFYTDGVTVWNRSHQVMPNGTGLYGDPSSSQSAIIVPKIGDTTKYYVFTVAQLSGPNGLRYSMVDMNLDNGNGAITLKNVPLQSNVVEKITAVRHCNNKDIWVVAHGSKSDIYYSFLVTAAGISTTPVISHSGAVLPGVVAPSTQDSSSLGYLKASPNGKRIAAAHWTVGADVSDFDNATGIVSNTFNLFLPTEGYHLPYGIEFSNNSNLVYTTVFYIDPINFFPRNVLLQYDLTVPSIAGIRASKQVISGTSDPIQVFAALQLAPDGKMYMARNVYKYISSISNPNVVGAGCNFTANAVQYTLNNQESSFGLPTFVQSYFYPVDSFTYKVNCPGLNTSFNYTPLAGVSNVLWDFGDPVSGSNNASTLLNPAHTYSTPGTYNVKLIKFTSCGPDTLKQTINTNSLSTNLGPDITICGGTNILLNAGATGGTNTFLWQDGSTNPTFLATTAGLYWVEETNSLGCSHRDSINVNFNAAPPVFNLGLDSAICAGDTLVLNATVSGATSYLWSTGATTPVIKAYQAGTYWCEVNKGGCVFRDSLVITAVKTRPVVNLGNDTTTCGGNSITLNATNTNTSYLWQDGSTSPIFLATATGLYWVEAKHISGCIKRDSINIKFNPPPVFNLGVDNSLCTGDTLLLNATVSGALSYRWSTGATTPVIKAFQAGIYWCEVNNGCLARDSIAILSVKPAPVVNLGADQTLCEGITVNLDATNANSTYLWQDGTTGPVYAVSKPGLYAVQVNLNGCKKSDTTIIKYNLKPKFTLGPDQFICQGNTVTLAPALDPLWQLKWQDGTSNSTYVVSQQGVYSLTATNSCGATFDEVLFLNGVCKIFVPTAFTPNGDGNNDQFKILGTDLITQFNLKIFNRYGQVIFETNDKAKGWDGMVKGKASPESGFVYLLNYKELNSDELKTIKGSFILVR